MGTNRKQLRSAAQKQVRKGNWQKAIENYEQLVELDPDDVRSRLKLADLYTRVGREDRAVETYCEAGDHHAGQDIYQKAVAVYKQAIRLEPDDPTLHRKVGEAYHRLDRLKDAVHSFKRAHEYYKESGDRERQIEILEELVRLDPQDVGLRIQLAETYAKEDDDDRALEMFREAADMLAEEGDHDEYVQVAERILYFDPDAEDVRKRAIRIYIDRNDNKRALKHLQVCFNSNSRDTETLRKLAETFLRLDRTEKASLVFEKLAGVYRDQGRIAEARPIWKQLREIDPTNETARAALRKFGEPDEDQPRPESPAENPRERAESEDIPTIAGDADSSADESLDDIEFLDEGPQTPEPREGVAPNPEANPAEERVEAPSDSGNSAIDIRGRSIESPSGGDGGQRNETNPSVEASRNRGDGSPSNSTTDFERSREPTHTSLETPLGEEGPSADFSEENLGETSSTGSDKLDELLNEADVFLKYELYDRAREVIQRILERDPNSLAAYSKRRRLYKELGEPRAEAATLVDMARMASHQPPKARHFLREALEVGGADERVWNAAEELDIDLPSARGTPDHATSPPRETRPSIEAPDDSNGGFDEPTPAGRGETPIQGDHDFDKIDLDSTEGAEDDSGEFMHLESSEVELVDEETTAPPPPESPDEPFAEDSGEADELFDAVEEVDEVEETTDDQLDGLGFTETEVEGALDGVFAGIVEATDGIDVSDEKDGDQSIVDEKLAVVDSLLEKDQFDDAGAALKAIADEYPDHPGVKKRRNRIETERRRGEFERRPTGSRSLSGAFKPEEVEPDESPDAEVPGMDSGIVNTHLEVGTAYREMGMYQDAIDEFRQAIEDPDAAPAAKLNIALCKAETGQVAEASEVLERIAENDGLSPKLRTAARQKLDELE